MNFFEKKQELQKFLQNSEAKIGFVPTMGALHEGHLSLIDRALQENERVVVSIFVNPTQFNNKEDLQKYPRMLDADCQKIWQLNKDVIIFAPEIDDVYGEDVVSEVFDFQGLDLVMEGSFRPGHFDGVGTIVKKLFQIVQPHNAYFGEKDYQQFLIIKKMVEQTQLPVNVIPCPIIREENGLAMSSRNLRLSQTAREKSALIFRTLQKSKEMYRSGIDFNEIQQEVEKIFTQNPDFQLEYFSIANAETLQISHKKENGQTYRAFITAYIENIRLIDNIEL